MDISSEYKLAANYGSKSISKSYELEVPSTNVKEIELVRLLNDIIVRSLAVKEAVVVEILDEVGLEDYRTLNNMDMLSVRKLFDKEQVMKYRDKNKPLYNMIVSSYNRAKVSKEDLDELAKSLKK